MQTSILCIGLGKKLKYSMYMVDKNRKYVIAKFTNSGFGDHLSCVFGAWWYAKSTNRTLVVDWRGSRFNPEQGKNCFFSFFKQVTSLAGVPIIANNDVADINFPTPFYPDKWTSENIRASKHVPHTSTEIFDINALVENTIPHDESTIIMNQHIHPLPPKAEMRHLLSDLEFSASVKDAADTYTRQHLGDAPAIGIHIRHGNGENIGTRAAYWLDCISLIKQLLANERNDIHQHSSDNTAAKGIFHDNAAPSLMYKNITSRAEHKLYKNAASYVNDLREALGLPDARVFLCTDAARVENGLRQKLGSLYTYPKRMMGEGGGPLHQLTIKSASNETRQADLQPVEKEIVMDMLIELEILRRCNALVCIPSQFSIISRLELPKDRLYVLRPPLCNRIISRFLT